MYSLSDSDLYILLCALIIVGDNWGLGEEEKDILKKFRSHKRFSTQFENIDRLIESKERL